MFKSYIKATIRNMHKNKLDTILNLSGLSLGLSLTIIILFHISDELSYDHHFPKSQRIFRMSCEMKDGNNVRHWATTSPMLSEYLSQSIPEIEKTCRMFVIPSQILSYFPENGPVRRFKESSGFFADQSSVELFDLNFLNGNPEKALSEVNSIVLTQSTAEKFFPHENPLGKMLSFKNSNNPEDFLMVTGVIQNLPSNTHFDFAYLVSFPTFYVFLREIGQEQLAQAKGWAALYNYTLLKNKNLLPSVEEKLTDFTVQYFQGMGSREEILSKVNFHIRPIVDIHLHSNLEQEFEANSDMNFIYMFSVIAMFIMVVIAINFININIAQALRRIREVGVRKVLGVSRAQLMSQFLSESLFYILVAIIISLFLIQLFLPLYNSFSGKTYVFNNFFQKANIFIFLGIILLLGVMASIYPAFFISGFNPVKSLKGMRDPLSTAARLRKGLVIFQFTISIFMIFGTIITYQQTEYFKNKNVGFTKENIIAIQLNNELHDLAIKSPLTLKNELLKNSGILAASIVSDIPGDRLSVENLRVDGAADIDERGQFRFIRVDKDYLKVLNIQITKGRDFSNISKEVSAFIINESAAKVLQVKEIVGRSASNIFGRRGEIIGVVKDFNFASLHNLIEPLVIELLPQDHQMRSVLTTHLLLKIKDSDIQNFLQSLESTIDKLAPNSLFNYSFLNQDLNHLYNSEQRLSNLFRAFALLAIFISCLGLFGLSSYSAQLRVKEIGVRKTLGATIFGIIHLMSKKYISWIIIANIIALPLGWIYVNDWLNQFAYRTNIGIIPFIFTILISIGMTFITVSYHALKTAAANPVDSLRYE